MSRYISSQGNDPRPCFTQRLDCLSRGAVAGDNPGSARGMLEQLGAEGESGAAVEDHRLRVRPSGESRRELRVVRQRRSDADEDGIVDGPELVRQVLGLWPADRQPRA